MALDNAEARAYVNKLCMILDLPLLEAGTTGYIGQVFRIFSLHNFLGHAHQKRRVKML